MGSWQASNGDPVGAECRILLYRVTELPLWDKARPRRRVWGFGIIDTGALEGAHTMTEERISSRKTPLPTTKAPPKALMIRPTGNHRPPTPFPSGSYRRRAIPFPKWVPSPVGCGEWFPAPQAVVPPRSTPLSFAGWGNAVCGSLGGIPCGRGRSPLCWFVTG